ncbi:Hypothetical predicted protein [Octopus vulgaris]|uniref:Uncharacterized protein n=1 Tax=Octopus vulgaris TaxID=6645 RepID=A0AA36B6L2_OCTVU|nr:Hypothetical predicted protein [Octopus vulgaris]
MVAGHVVMVVVVMNVAVIGVDCMCKMEVMEWDSRTGSKVNLSFSESIALWNALLRSSAVQQMWMFDLMLWEYMNELEWRHVINNENWEKSISLRKMVKILRVRDMSTISRNRGHK